MEKSKKELLKEKLKGKSIHKYFENLYKEGIEVLLEAELDDYLGYQKHY
jgi:transposase-like protein